MTIFSVAIEVRVRAGVRDPQGEAIAIALRRQGEPIGEIAQGKLFEVEIDAADAEVAREIAGRIAGTVLSNPLIEDTSVGAAIAIAAGDSP